MEALRIEALTKTYPNGVEALKGIDLSVQHGEFCALLGPNGAGKSTTIGIVTSLVNKSSGRVTIYGHDLVDARVQAKSCLGVVPQEINLSMFEKLIDIVVNQGCYYGLTRREAAVRAQKYLERLQLWDRRDDIARNLSGGMKRRLMIARALVHEPRLLILDEPTAGVDIEIRRDMWAFLEDLNAAGTTIILTTHYLEEAEQLCRHLAIIDGGRVVEDDSMDNVLRKLHTETYVLTPAAPLSAAPALDGLVARLRGDGDLEVDIDRGTHLNGLLAALTRAGIEVLAMRNKANRLETLFLDLTRQDRAAVEDAA